MKKNNTFEIYMFSEKHPDARNYIFHGWEYIKKHGLTFSKYNYEKVYEGKLNEETGIDDIYRIFNINHPEDYKNRSVSVSDVIIITRNYETRVFYVDRIGFKDVTGQFFDEKLTSDDFADIHYVNTEYGNSGHTASHHFIAEIRKRPVNLIYSVNRHDGDEESFNFYSDDIDLHNALTVTELHKLDDIFRDEVKIGRYENKFEKCQSIDELKEIEYEFMEDELFPKSMNIRFWVAHSLKKDELNAIAGGKAV